MILRSLPFILLITFFNINAQCITINNEPQDQIIVTHNDIILTNNTSLKLSVDATSAETLSYQWEWFDSTNGNWEILVDNDEFLGTTSNTLTVNNINSINNEDLFKVSISTTNGSCPITTSREIKITKLNIIVNNFFSPNGDSINETFNIEGVNNPTLRDHKLLVFNRWGNAVFETRNYQNDWNGISNTSFSFRGTKVVPTGTYFYTMVFKYRDLKISGWVQIAR